MKIRLVLKSVSVGTSVTALDESFLPSTVALAKSIKLKVVSIIETPLSLCFKVDFLEPQRSAF